MMPSHGGSVARRGCKTRARAQTLCPRPSAAPGAAPGTTAEPNVPGLTPFGNDPFSPPAEYDAVGRRTRGLLP